MLGTWCFVYPGRTTAVLDEQLPLLLYAKPLDDITTTIMAVTVVNTEAKPSMSIIILLKIVILFNIAIVVII